MSLKSTREERARKRNQPVVDLLAEEDAYLEKIDRKLAEADGTEDFAQKIVKLRDVEDSIKRARFTFAGKQKLLASDRTTRTAGKLLLGAMVAGFALMAIPAAMASPFWLIAAPFIGALIFGGADNIVSVKAVDRAHERKLLKQNPGLHRAAGAMQEKLDHISEALAETSSPKNFGKIYQSVYRNDAFEHHKPLKEAFDKALAKVTAEIMYGGPAHQQAQTEIARRLDALAQ